jgi:hypothetical protein
MVQLEFDFNERKKTAVEWLEEELADNLKVIILNNDYQLMEKLFEQAKEMEEQRLREAIMYTLDEDGHTGEWKIKFANNYINNLKQTK